MKRVRFSLAIAVVVALMTACNNRVKDAKTLAQLTENHDTDQLQREAKDVVTGQKYDLTKDLTLAPRQTLIVEF